VRWLVPSPLGGPLGEVCLGDRHRGAGGQVGLVAQPLHGTAVGVLELLLDRGADGVGEQEVDLVAEVGEEDGVVGVVALDLADGLEGAQDAGVGRALQALLDHPCILSNGRS
jgi:hypothetical protein